MVPKKVILILFVVRSNNSHHPFLSWVAINLLYLTKQIILILNQLSLLFAVLSKSFLIIVDSFLRVTLKIVLLNHFIQDVLRLIVLFQIQKNQSLRKSSFFV